MAQADNRMLAQPAEYLIGNIEEDFIGGITHIEPPHGPAELTDQDVIWM